MDRGQLLVRGAIALQAVIFAASCGYGRRDADPLRGRRAQIGHLLRRASFGADAETLDESEALGLGGTIDRLLDAPETDDELDRRIRALGLDLKRLPNLQRWWLMRMIYTEHPLREKMVLFWHGFLTSGSAKVGLPNPTPRSPNPPHHLLNQHNFLRKHALDTYPAILNGIAKDPAMMVWLDAQTSHKNKPNENFARELLELFTVGIGNFDEADVRDTARAFTGRALENGVYAFRLANHDTGVKRVLGKRGNLRSQDVLALLADHPRTAERLARKLWEFFAYKDPTPKELGPLVTAYTASGGSIKKMLRVLFTSPAFYSPRAYRALVKSPTDYVVGTLRSLKATSTGANLPGITTRMGQALFNPPNVAGWPGGVNWLNTTTWIERTNFANHVATARNDANTTAPQFSHLLEKNGLRTPEQIVDFFAGTLLDGQIAPHMRRILLAYLRSGQGAASPVPVGSKSKPSFNPTFVDQKVRGLVYLLLASPEYHLA